jgi:hypothetical protein
VIDDTADPLDTAVRAEPFDAIEYVSHGRADRLGHVSVRGRGEREPLLGLEQDAPVQRRQVGGGALADPRRRHVRLGEALAGEAVGVDDRELQVDVEVGEHREDQDCTSRPLLDLGDDLVAPLFRRGGHDEPHVPLVVACVVVIHLVVAVDHGSDRLEAVLGCLNRRERRTADDRWVQDRAESPDDPLVVESLDTL